MKLFDMHCDTPLELYLRRQGLADNTLHVSLDKAADFDNYIQCAAVWSDASLSDGDCFYRFSEAVSYLKNQLAMWKTPLIKSSGQLDCDRGLILTVEGARLICGELSRIDDLYNAGVRIMTLVWKGSDSIGGAWDTDIGLTPLGRSVVEKCLDVGIIPDVSHGSRRLTSEVLEIMKSHGKAPLATHSNAFSVCSHSRNLDDDTISEIASVNGLCGISFCTFHLSEAKAGMNDIFYHIDKYIDLGGSENVCFGCDFDGISETPEGIKDLSSMKILFDAAVRRYGSDTAENIFYNNAYKYMKSNLPSV